MKHRLKTGLSALAISLLCSASAQAAPPKDPAGTWLTEDGAGRIRVEKCTPTGDTICGFVVWTKKPTDDDGQPRRDAENPDAGKQSRLILGHQMIMGLKPNHDGRYEGQIYNAENGKTYEVTFWVDPEGAAHVKGCVLKYLCGSQAWTRVTDVAPGELTGLTDGPKGPRHDPH